MAGYILHGEERSVVLRSTDVDKVLALADGDTALLYLALMRADRGVSAEALMQSLRLTPLRLAAAEQKLQGAGILSGRTALPVTEERQERPCYTQQELASILTDPEFSALRQQIGEKLGKRMSLADDQILAGLYHDMGFPADVVFLLVSHCMERSVRRYGPGRTPTMRQIEKEGYYWARIGICDQDSAALYLKQYAVKIEAIGRYMKILRLGERPPVESEQRYIMDWIDKGFPPETVALAYDRTILRKQTLEWRYLNGILRRWHESGWHTVAEVEAGERDAGNKRGKTSSGSEDDSWMKEYM